MRSGKPSVQSCEAGPARYRERSHARYTVVKRRFSSRIQRVFASVTVVGVLGFEASSASAALLAYWDFNVGGVGGTAQTANTAPTSLAATTGSGTLTYTGTSTAPSYFSGTTVNGVTGETAGSAYSPVGGTQSGSVYANNGSAIQFSLSLTGYTAPVVTYATQRTSTGFTTQAWSYSTDGGTTFTTLTSITSIPTAFATQTIDFSGVSALANLSTALFRVTLTGATAAAGNNRFDNIQFNSGVFGNSIYFDTNGTTAGSGVTAGSVYALSTAKFNNLTDGTGPVSTLAAGFPATFSAGTDAAGLAYTINVDTAFSTAGLAFEEGNVTVAHATGGSLTLTAAGVDVASGASATISEAVAGSVGVTKTGNGTLTLNGTNTFTGTVAANAGTLAITADASLGNSANGLTFGGGILKTTASLDLASARAVNGAGSFDIASGTTLTVNGTYGATTAGLLSLANSGTLTLAGTANTVNGVTFASTGTLNASGGVLALNGNVTSNNTAATATIAGAANLNAAASTVVTRTFTVNDGTADVDLLVSANLSGAATIAKLGGGTLKLTGNNAGLTGGSLSANGTLASIRLGTAAATPVTGGTLAFDNASALGTAQFQLNGGTLRNDAAGKLTITNNAGSTTVAAISLGAQDATATPGGQLFAGSELEFTGPLQQFAPTSTTYSHAITVNNTTTFSGGILATQAGGSGVTLGTSGGLKILGNGRAIFSGAALNSEAVTVGGSSLASTTNTVTVLANNATNSLGTGGVTINTGGTLAGGAPGVAGAVGGAVTVATGGTISAGTGATTGDTPGTLASGNQTWQSGGTYVWKTLASSGTAGTTWDLLNMGTLGGASGFTVKAILGSGGTFVAPPLYSGLTKFKLADTTNTATLDVAGLFILNTSGLGITNNQGTFTLSFDPDGGGTYDLNLNFQAAPEPTTAGLLGLAFAPLLGRRRSTPRAA